MKFKNLFGGLYNSAELIKYYLCRWSLIAGRLPGRTDNEIKNYWNTNLSKRLQANKVNDFGERHGNLEEIASMKISSKSKSNGPELNSKTLTDSHRHVIRTKAFRCKKVAIPWLQLQADHDHHHHQMVDKNIVPRLASETPTFSGLESFDTNFLNDLDINDIVFLDVELNSELCEPKGIKINEECGNKDAVDGENGLEGVSRFDLTKFDDQSSMDETITRFENIVPGLACDTPFSSGLNNSNTGFLNDFHIYDLYSDVVLHSELWESKAERLD